MGDHPVISRTGSGITRAPFRDLFHVINGVNKTGNEGVPLEKAELGSDLFYSLRDIPKTELEPVVNYLMNTYKPDSLSAETRARSEYRKKGIIRNTTCGRGDDIDTAREHGDNMCAAR